MVQPFTASATHAERRDDACDDNQDTLGKNGDERSSQSGSSSLPDISLDTGQMHNMNRYSGRSSVSPRIASVQESDEFGAEMNDGQDSYSAVTNAAQRPSENCTSVER